MKEKDVASAFGETIQAPNGGKNELKNLDAMKKKLLALSDSHESEAKKHRH